MLRPSQCGVAGARSWNAYWHNPANDADRTRPLRGLRSVSSLIWDRKDPLQPRPGNAGWRPANGNPWWCGAGATSTSHTGDMTDRVSDVEVTGEPRDTETVRHGMPGVNCPRRGPEVKADDSEATASPRPERARGQEPGRKAGDVRRRVGHGPATPAQYGESRIARTPMSSGGSSHSSVPRLYTRRHREPRILVSFVGRLARWAMPSEGI
jgi:hypothetical protein